MAQTFEAFERGRERRVGNPKVFRELAGYDRRRFVEVASREESCAERWCGLDFVRTWSTWQAR
jgi:hypothetical protein